MSGNIPAALVTDFTQYIPVDFKIHSSKISDDAKFVIFDIRKEDEHKYALYNLQNETFVINFRKEPILSFLGKFVVVNGGLYNPETGETFKGEITNIEKSNWVLLEDNSRALSRRENKIVDPTTGNIVFSGDFNPFFPALKTVLNPEPGATDQPKFITLYGENPTVNDKNAKRYYAKSFEYPSGNLIPILSAESNETAPVVQMPWPQITNHEKYAFVVGGGTDFSGRIIALDHNSINESKVYKRNLNLEILPLESSFNVLCHGKNKTAEIINEAGDVLNTVKNIKTYRINKSDEKNSDRSIDQVGPSYKSSVALFGTKTVTVIDYKDTKNTLGTFNAKNITNIFAFQDIPFFIAETTQSQKHLIGTDGKISQPFDEVLIVTATHLQVRMKNKIVQISLGR